MARLSRWQTRYPTSNNAVPPTPAIPPTTALSHQWSYSANNNNDAIPLMTMPFHPITMLSQSQQWCPAIINSTIPQTITSIPRMDDTTPQLMVLPPATALPHQQQRYLSDDAFQTGIRLYFGDAVLCCRGEIIPMSSKRCALLLTPAASILSWNRP